MSRSKHSEPHGQWFLKGALLLAAGVCLVVGIIGIVLPVIPGVLFLLLALWLIAKASRRAAAYLEQHPGWRKQQRFWGRTRYLALHERLQLSCWLAVKAVVDGTKRIVEKFTNNQSRS